jgi:hypothetical protein
MPARVLPTFLGATGLAAVLLLAAVPAPSPAQELVPFPQQGTPSPVAQIPPPPGDAANGPEVQTRGPIHEAYAEPVDPKPGPGPVVPKRPPDPVEEMPPDQKPEGSVWIAGYWAWDQDRSDFLWVSGFWRVPPPGRQWVPGYWQPVDGGWQWVPGFWSGPGQSEMEYLPTPPPSIESGPSVPSPGEDYIYNPGCWIYRDTRYVWQPGFWCESRPDWLWVPSRYLWTPAGCVFVAGYWDYPLGDRGLLFAPVSFPQPLLAQAGYSYTPSYVIPDDGLFDALFVGPHCRHYFFGDYFGPDYQQAGFVPWLDFRLGRGAYDPLFAYYAHRYHDHGWERDLRGLYAGRARGTIARPPDSLRQQERLLRNGAGGGAAGRSLAMVRPLSQVGGQGLWLAAVPRQERLQAQAAGQQLHRVAHNLQQGQSQLLAHGGPARVGEPARRMRVDLPGPRGNPGAGAVHTPPPTPTPGHGRPAGLNRPVAPATPPATHHETAPTPATPPRHEAPRPPMAPQHEAPHTPPPATQHAAPPPAAHAPAAPHPAPPATQHAAPPPPPAAHVHEAPHPAPPATQHTAPPPPAPPQHGAPHPPAPAPQHAAPPPPAAQHAPAPPRAVNRAPTPQPPAAHYAAPPPPAARHVAAAVHPAAAPARRPAPPPHAAAPRRPTPPPARPAPHVAAVQPRPAPRPAARPAPRPAARPAQHGGKR